MTTYQPEHFLARCARLAMSVTITWTALYFLGGWCLYSTESPPRPFALPLADRLLTGLGFLLFLPFSLTPIALLFAMSGHLALKLNRPCFAAIVLVALAFVILGAFWVPNPILLWPLNAFGKHTAPELVGELFPFTIVPAPKVSYLSSAGVDSLFRWQFMEIGARLGVLVFGWSVFLVAMRRIDARMRASTTARGPVHTSDATE